MDYPFGIREIRRHLIGDGEPVVLCLCRNEEYYLASLLRHYRTLGFRNFVFLDNGSEDRTVDILAAAPDVTLLTSNWPYRLHQDDFKRTLIAVFGRDRWSLIVDADEFLAIPLVPPAPPEKFFAYLDENRFNAVFTPLLDMFAPGMLRLEDCDTPSMFDASEYTQCSLDTVRKPYFHNKWLARVRRGFLRYRGGIREHVFGVDCALHKFALTKHTGGRPLYKRPHNIYELRAKVADVSAVLLHYKFTSDFPRRIRDAVITEQFFNSSAEYKKYDRVLSEKSTVPRDLPVLTFAGPEDLCARGFGFMSDAFCDYMRT